MPASVGLKQAADAAEVDESTVSRWKEKLITQFCRVLARIGLKVVPTNMHCYPEAEIEALRILARRSDVLRPHGLEWED